jgi:hypothetical protein
MRFDWYQATVPARSELIVEGMLENLPYSGFEVSRERGVNTYLHGDYIRDGVGQTICAVYHGGHNPLPNVKASGVYSPDVATVMRGLWPHHFVTRADIAIDFDGPGAWGKLLAICRDQALKSGLSISQAGDWVRPDGPKGRTFYVGARSSAVMLRLYEKGKQMALERRVGEQEPSQDWTRLELVVKPQNKPAKLTAAAMEPDRFWGCAPWARRVLSQATETDVERVNMNLQRETDLIRSFRHMAIQYRQIIEGVISETGSEEAMIQLMKQVWATADRERQFGATHASEATTH